MELETQGGIFCDFAEESDIINAFADDKKRGEFIILSQSEEVYIQAAGEGFGPYILEFRDGDKDRHFQCTKELSKPDVQSVFIKYLEDDPSWMTDLEWEPLDMG